MSGAAKHVQPDRALHRSKTGQYAISIDVGGTFTDFVLFDLDLGKAVAFHKVLTTPQEPARAVITGWRELLQMARIAPEEIDYAVHSTTLITNAIVERRGVKTALITTCGFRDVLEIGIEQLYSIYDLFAPYPLPLIPRHLRYEISERMSRDGAVIELLDEPAVRALVDELAAGGVEAIAVSLIHAYRNSEHERRIRQIIEETHPEITVSLSSQVAPLIGEYERTSTVAADAYVKPLLRRYLSDLLVQLHDEGFHRPFFLVLSSGGITSASAAMAFPIRLLESGPAAGAFTASFYGSLCGHRNVLSLDMGGTTAKACLVEDGKPDVARMLEADRVHRFMPGSGLPIMVPAIDLIETGAGGGSIAHINDLGLINVGPQSAGSDPGPASYGLGGQHPTVTDANVLLGYLDPAYFLGGRMMLDREHAQEAVKTLVADPLNLSVTEAAWGIHSIVNENMARAARTHIIERNRDPRHLALVAFGGAGPAHALAVARILGISWVIVPLGAGVASAVGALAAPMTLPLVRSYITRLKQCDWDTVQQLYTSMKADAYRSLEIETASAEPILLHAAADMRFAGQYHEIQVDLPPVEDLGTQIIDQMERRFHDRYISVYGRAPSGLEIEVLNWHLVAEVPRIGLKIIAESPDGTGLAIAVKGVRDVYFAQPVPGYCPCPVYDRYRLSTGLTFSGPCIIEEPEATTVIPPSNTVTIDQYRNIVVNLGTEGDER